MMAESDVSLHKSGGFDVEFVEENVSKQNITCSICLLVLREPMQAVPCGHRFCKSCINLEKERQNSDDFTCPNDRETISIFPDVGKQREILDFKVKCLNTGSTKCQWSGELRSLEEHLKQCKYQELECVKKCGKKGILRKYMLLHLEVECTKNMSPCNFASIGCQFKGKAKELENHMETHTFQHLVLQVENQNERISYLEQNLSDETNKNFKLKAKVAESTNEINELKRKNREADENIIKFRKEIDFVSKFKRKCPFKFTITGVPSKMKKKGRLEVRSEIFEFFNGYRARLVVEFNYSQQNVLPAKEYTSVYLQIMKGPHDDLLEWPMTFGRVFFKCLVNGKIISQKSFIPTVDNFLQPGNDGGSKWGFPQFLDQSFKDLRPLTGGKIDFVVDIKQVVS